MAASEQMNLFFKKRSDVVFSQTEHRIFCVSNISWINGQFWFFLQHPKYEKTKIPFLISLVRYMTVIQSDCVIIRSVISPELTCHFDFLHSINIQERKRPNISLHMGVIRHDSQLYRYQDYSIDNILPELTTRLYWFLNLHKHCKKEYLETPFIDVYILAFQSGFLRSKTEGATGGVP